MNSQAPDFEASLKEVAEKENATMALEAIAGDFTEKVFHALPPNSTLYLYGALSGDSIKNINIFYFFQNKTMEVLNIFNYSAELTKKGELVDFYKEIHKYLSTIFKSTIQKVFKLEDIKEALAYYEENSSKGKILIQPN